jgi:predicted transposase YbfD/YdcC
MNHNTLGIALQDATDGYVFEVGSVRDVLEDVADARDPRGKRWPQAVVLLFALLAKLAGEDKLRGIAQWINLRIGWLNHTLQLRPRFNRKRQLSGPHATTYSRVLGKAVDVQQLELQVHALLAGLPRTGLAIQVTLDGKRIHGTLSADNPSGVYLLSVFVPQVGVVLLQAAIEAHQNELTVAPTVLECLDLQGKIVTGDALFCQRDLSIQIVAGGGEYLWKVKENQPRLLSDIQFVCESPAAQPARKRPPAEWHTVSSVDKSHGRLERRTLTVSSELTGYLDWPHAEQVFKYEYQYQELTSGERGSRVSYGITSLTAAEADAAYLLRMLRAHWMIENGVHYRRDVTLHEDACRLRWGHAAHVMAILNNLLLSLVLRLGHNLPDLRRTFNAQPQQALALLIQRLT